MRDLWRLSVWGVSAAVALTIAIVAAATDAGSDRARRAALKLRDSMMSSGSNPDHPLGAAETRMLAETVRALIADRERLITRIAKLEHNVGDVTGSITRIESAMRTPAVAIEPAQTAPAPPSPPVAMALPEAAAPAQSPAAAIPPPPPQIVAPAQSPSTVSLAPPQIVAPAQSPPEVFPAPPQTVSPTRKPAPRAAVPQQLQPPPQPMASKPPDDDVTSSVAAADIPSEEPEARPLRSVPVRTTVTSRQFGLDLGSGRSEDALRANWSAAQRRYGTLLQGLQPVMAAHGQSRGRATYRLVAGPIDNAAKAARFCAAITAMGGACQPAPYDGQRLAAY